MEVRLQREQETVKVLINLYCKNNHATQPIPCRECEELLRYAVKRVEHCQFGASKPICGRCKIHCYKPDMRIKIREVMKTTGYKLLLKHPILFMTHLVDIFRY